MKKIVLASAAMGGAALLAFGASGTFAMFSDEVSTNTTGTQAGTLYLDISGASTASTSSRSASNLAPGDTVTFVTPVKNAGTLAGGLELELVEVLDEENDCVAPERTLEPSCDDDGDGELPGALLATSAFAVLDAGVACTADTVLPELFPGNRTDESLAALQTENRASLELGPGQTFCSVITVTLPASADNSVQSDVFSFRIDANLSQQTS